jgi:hypothetical protein
MLCPLVSIMTLPPHTPHHVYSLSRYFGRKVQLGLANRRQKLGLVWRNRKKISQIINDYLCLPFFLLIILWSDHYSEKLLEKNFFPEYTYGFRPQRIQSARISIQPSELGPPRPSPARECMLPPPGSKGGETLAGGVGGGGTQFRRWGRKVLWYSS